MLARGRVTARTASIPAPTGGLNDRDALASMPKNDAVVLENWWVEPSRLITRKGCIDWATGFDTPAMTVFEYAPPNGTYKLFAAAGENIYDITASGEIDNPVVNGLSSDRFHIVSATTAADPPAGSYLYAFNGVDKALLYDGTTWTPVDGSSDPAITGVDTDSIVSGCVFKGRLYMVQRQTMNVWYLPPASIGGAATKVSMSSIFQRGGYIVGVYTWTLDAGTGSDDHLVILSSNGEVAVYAGTDPSSADTFALIGLFYVGRPIGTRPCIKYGGDLIILCEQGIYPLSQALITATIDRRSLITDKIQNSVNSAINRYKLNFGFEMCLYPEQNALILNVPAGNGGNYQFVRNSITGAWTKFTGWDARTFVNTGLGLFFSDGDSVKRAWTGESDAGALITCDVLQAFQGFGTPVRNKYFTMVRPYLRTTGNPSVLYGLNGDFNPETISGVLDFTPPDGMVWGSMEWGSMVWGGSARLMQHWQTLGKLYRYAAPRIRVQNNFSSTEWSATDLVYSAGGIL